VDVLRDESFTIDAKAMYHGPDSSGAIRHYRGKSSVTERRRPGPARIHLSLTLKPRDGRSPAQLPMDRVDVHVGGPDARKDVFRCFPPDEPCFKD